MKKKILIVEDDKMICQLESIILELRGYDIISAENGQAALDILIKELPDLVLLDVMLPGVDGYAICQHIKSNPATKNIPVIMLTAKKTAEDIKKGYQMGADEYVTKPFRSAALLETIASYLN